MSAPGRAAVLLLLAIGGAPARAAESGTSKGHHLEHPIVLVGLDGVDWQILDPLIEAGRTPHLARLKNRAAWGHLRSFEPLLSPLLWTTAATGRAPDEHGIIDFLVADPATGRRQPITSRERRVRALWNIFSERGLSADVVAWWATWPAEPIDGRIVSDRVAYSLFDVGSPAAGTGDLTHPPALWERIRPHVVSDAEMGYERVARFVDVSGSDFDAARRRAAESPNEAYHEPLNHLAKILASTETYHRIALDLLRQHQPDLFAVYYQGVDEVSHRFAHFMPPRMEQVSEREFAQYHRAVEEFYVYQDELLGQLFARIAPESIVVVLSDHGFLSGPARPGDVPADIEGKPGKWHRAYGVILIAGAGIPAGRLDSATLFDITPTVLTLAGLPVAQDMRGRPLLARPGGAGEAPRSIASYEPAPLERAAASGVQGAAVDAEMLDRLAALGYVGAVAAPAGSATGSAVAPGAPTAHTNLAAVLLQNGDLAGAEGELRRALERHPDYVPALLTLSQVLSRLDRAGEALDAARAAVARAADVEDSAYVQLAFLAVRAGRVDEAVAFLTDLRASRPAAPGVRTGLGILAEHASTPQAAEAHFRAALALTPASTEPLGQLFQMYRERSRETELEPLVRQALALNERSVLHRNWLGLILARRGDTAGAEAELRRALELAPDFGGTMTNLGSLYGRAGRLEEAVAILTRAVRIEPRNLEARVNLGAALGKLGRLDAAIVTLEEARGMGLCSTALLNAVGLAYAQKGEVAPAREALRESLELSPDQPEVRSLLAELSRAS